MASGGGRDAKPAFADPGLALLTRIGDFVEPLTRFDRGHLKLEGSRHEIIDVTARQTFKVTFATTPTEGNGPLPPGVVQVDGSTGLTRASDDQLVSARAAVPARLALWAQAHGEDPVRRPVAADCFMPVSPIGYVQDCAACQGSGAVACVNCQGARTITCATCSGRGNLACNTCGASGDVRCARCKGAGYLLVSRQESYVDAVTNTTTQRTVDDRQTCPNCTGGVTRCDKCQGRGAVACRTCGGRCTIDCPICKASGTQTCAACEGHGRRHHTGQLSCAISETFEVSSRSTELVVADVFKAMTSIDQVLAYASSSRSSAEANAVTLRRDTIAATPLTTVTLAVGTTHTQIRGFGPGQEIRDFGNIAGLLLTGDLDLLEATLPATRLMPPTTSPDMEAALGSVLASEVNVAIAESAAKKDMIAVTLRFRGVVSADYIARAAKAIRTATARAYAATMLRGPAAVLALPLLQLPVELLVRNQPDTSRMMAMIGVMLFTLAGAIGAHILCVRKLQHRICPDRVPSFFRITDKQRLLLYWLLGAGALAVLGTLAVAGIVGAIFPASPPLLIPVGVFPN